SIRFDPDQGEDEFQFLQPGAACTNGSGPSTGNFTFLNVQPPDESAGAVNHSVYTNAVAGVSMDWCIEAAEKLGKPIPAAWKAMQHSMYLPVVDDLYEGGPVHPEYSTYHGQVINQADVALLQYPLEVPMPKNVAINDLEYVVPENPLRCEHQCDYGSHRYYQAKTDPNGYFTGDSAYSIAWLRLNNRTSADEQFFKAFLHMDTE
ncbi:pgghg, partial [Symbiodinium sp. KB8]